MNVYSTNQQPWPCHKSIWNNISYTALVCEMSTNEKLKRMSHLVLGACFSLTSQSTFRKPELKRTVCTECFSGRISRIWSTHRHSRSLKLTDSFQICQLWIFEALRLWSLANITSTEVRIKLMEFWVHLSVIRDNRSEFCFWHSSHGGHSCLKC